MRGAEIGRGVVCPAAGSARAVHRLIDVAGTCPGIVREAMNGPADGRAGAPALPVNHARMLLELVDPVRRNGIDGGDKRVRIGRSRGCRNCCQPNDRQDQNLHRLASLFGGGVRLESRTLVTRAHAQAPPPLGEPWTCATAIRPCTMGAKPTVRTGVTTPHGRD